MNISQFSRIFWHVNFQSTMNISEFLRIFWRLNLQSTMNISVCYISKFWKKRKEVKISFFYFIFSAGSNIKYIIREQKKTNETLFFRLIYCRRVYIYFKKSETSGIEKYGISRIIFLFFEPY